MTSSPGQRTTRHGLLLLSLLGGFLWNAALAQNDDRLRMTICNTDGECCAGGKSFDIDDAWVDPDTGDLHVEGLVFCAPGQPYILEFSVIPDTVSTGQQFTVEWLATDAEQCYAASDSLPWDGPVDLSGSETYTAEGPARTETLALVCWNPKGEDTRLTEFVITE